MLKSQLIKSVVFLLLKPIWLAKIEKYTFIEKNKRYLNIVKKQTGKIVEQATKYKSICKIKIESPFSYKNNQSLNIIKKINESKLISKNLYIWLNRQELIYKKSQSNFFLQQADHLEDLYKFCSVICYIGLEWFIYTNLQNYNLYLNLYLSNNSERIIGWSKGLIVNTIIFYLSKFINYHNLSLKTIQVYLWNQCYKYICLSNINIQIKLNHSCIVIPSMKSTKYILRLVKSKLYHKNEQGFWKINNPVSIHRILLFTNQLLNSWSFYYLDIIDDFYKIIISRHINETVFLWQRKKQKK